VPFFDNLLNTLAAQPDYHFVLDGQTLIVEDYLAQLSEDETVRREQASQTRQRRPPDGRTRLIGRWSAATPWFATS
jgi:hypothetical protein